MTGSDVSADPTAGQEGRRPTEPDVVVVDDRDPRVSEELTRLSYYLDELFVVPGTGYRVGLDPLLGLIPGVGDVATATASAYIVARAASLGVPRATLARMLLVLVVDAVVGSLPVVGDVFDAVWKANTRNVQLLEARLDTPERASDDRRFVVAVTALLTLTLLAVSVAVVVTAWWLVGRAGLF